ncbi:autotransporter family protein [Devosia neptuniae]|uniref:autotransporter family protein n=1 Tax=Devosia neptuniae TaxID=191302 RepID=UPI0029057702|nr:autotransporter outer membrane beta-barrel domain-containing protein [Devosia neptuniae]
MAGPVVGTTGQLYVGTGNLTIQNGSTLTSNGAEFHIGSVAGNNGTVTVTGAGSRWLTSGAGIEIGAGGTGTLNIQDGATVTSQSTVSLGTLSGTGTLNIIGGTLETNNVLRSGVGGQANFDNGILRARINNNFFLSGFTPGMLNIAGGGLTLDTQAFTLRVASVFSGVGGLTKTGTGTLTLTGSQLYAGPTVIQAGTLSLTGNGSLAASSRVVADGTFNASGITAAGTSIQSLAGSGAVTLGTKNLTITDAKNDVFSGIIAGAGGLTISGGTQTLTGTNTYAGPTIVRAGTLAVNGSITSATSVEAGGTLGGTGTIFGDVTSAGIVAPGNSIGTLTVAGNYISNGGALEVETVLGGDASPTDLLVITGNSILGSGPTQVGVVNLGGSGAATVEGIKIVDVAGISDAGAFALLGNYVFEGDQAVVGGAYAYRLYQNGVSTPADGDWYLRSTLTNPVIPPGTPPGTPIPPATPLYQPGVPLYESYANVLQSFNALGTLRQRLGGRAWSGAGVIETDLPQGNLGAWGRIEASHAKFDPQTSTSGASYDVDLWKLQAGADGVLYRGDAGSLIGGVSLEYGTLSADIASPHGDGSINSTGFGVGSALTWYGSTGFYLDGQARVTWYDSDLSSSTAGLNLATDNGGFGYAVSIEGGQQIALGPNWSITPQAQLAYSDVDFDSFTDAFDAAVSSDNGQSLKARLGISVDYRNEWTDEAGQAASADLYGIANLYYDMLDGSHTDVAGVKLASENDPLWGGVGIGGSYNWGDGKYALHGEASLNTSLRNFGDSYAAKGTVGLSVKF